MNLEDLQAQVGLWPIIEDKIMPSLHLHQRGVRLFAGRLYNHDYLWFSSNEISKVSTTQPFLHNYALCYALSLRSYRLCIGSTPKYFENPEAEFGAMSLYATPAQLAGIAQRITITFNAVNDLTLTTGDSKAMNTPNLGKRVYLNFMWEPYSSERPRRGYEFYVFTFDNYRLPGVCRLGKKGAPVRVRWQELSNPVAVYRESPQRPTHIVNPLDVGGKLVSYDPISIPPHLLLRLATITQDWFVFNRRHVVHVPKRVLMRAGGSVETTLKNS